MIKVKNLSKSYGSFQAISDLTFEIKKGELIGFIGPNGAGKTTTFNCLTTLLKPDKGEIKLFGLDALKSGREVRKILGFLPEDTPLINELSVHEYLKYRFNLKSFGKDGRTPSECMKICELSDVSRRIIGTLSKGFRQRVGIAESLLGKPEILLLDEPINGLDPEQIIKIRNLMISLKEKHTIIISSHILSELEQICDRFLIISKGKIKTCGSKKEILSKSPGIRKLVLTLSGESGFLKSQFESISGIDSVKPDDKNANTFLFNLNDNFEDPRVQIGQMIKETNLNILNLNLIEPNLESLYMELTRD